MPGVLYEYGKSYSWQFSGNLVKREACWNNTKPPASITYIALRRSGILQLEINTNHVLNSTSTNHFLKKRHCQFLFFVKLQIEVSIKLDEIYDICDRFTQLNAI